MEHGKPINHTLRIRPGYESEANGFLAWFADYLAKGTDRIFDVTIIKCQSESGAKYTCAETLFLN